MLLQGHFTCFKNARDMSRLYWMCSLNQRQDDVATNAYIYSNNPCNMLVAISQVQLTDGGTCREFGHLGSFACYACSRRGQMGDVDGANAKNFMHQGRLHHGSNLEAFFNQLHGNRDALAGVREFMSSPVELFDSAIVFVSLAARVSGTWPSFAMLRMMRYKSRRPHFGPFLNSKQQLMRTGSTTHCLPLARI